MRIRMLSPIVKNKSLNTFHESVWIPTLKQALTKTSEWGALVPRVRWSQE